MLKKSVADLNAVKVLIDVVNAGGFSAAARRLGVPANRLSRQIQRLEEEVGVRLLQRTTRRLSLTSAGRTILESAQPALMQIESTLRQVGSQADVPSGYLRVAAPADFLGVLSPYRLARFLDRYPAVNLEMVLSDDEADLFAGSVDMAFRAGPIRDETLVARHLTSSRLIVVASPVFIARRGLPQSPDAIESLPCLVARGKEGHGVWPLTGPEGPISIHVQARLTINGMGALILAAKAGLGIALVPEKLVQAELDAGSLMRLLPQFSFESSGFFAVYPSRRHPTAALRAFLDFVIEEARATDQ